MLPVLLAAYCCYGLAFIYRTSFVVGGVRYFALFDDAMISMRFARNLAAGFGFVYNPGGPRVEGFTNPLWTVYMAALHLLPVPAARMSLLIQLTGLAAMMATVALVWRLLLRTTASVTAAAVGATITAFYLPLNNWVLQGFEVGPLALIMTWAAARAAQALSERRFDPVPYWLLGVATLIRLDALVPAAALTLVLAALDPAHRRRHLAYGALGIGLLTAAQTAGRLWYFGYPFPNTYYLKMTGYPAAMRVERGALVMLAFILRLNPLLFAAAFLVVLARRRDATLWLLASMTAAVLAYSVYVGGDAWEWWGGSNRYVSEVMPLFFVLMATAFHDLWTRLAGAPPEGRRAVAAAAVFTAAALVNVNLLRHASSLEELTLVNPPFTVPETAAYVETSRLLDRLLDPDATIAVVQAGTLPYFAGRTVIDMLGKNDIRIAHEPMHLAKTTGLQQVKDFFPGHMKWDFPYAIGELKPDVVVELSRFPDEALPDVRGSYERWQSGGTVVYLKSGSPHVEWSVARATGTLSLP